MSNSTLGFNAVLAIPLPHQPSSLTLAAAHAHISVTWINSVNASAIDDRAYPQGNHRLLSREKRGIWRAHMDAIRTVIEKNFHTALILQDVRLREADPSLLRNDWDVLWLGKYNSSSSLAYAVTQRGARKIMYEHGIRNFDKGFGEALGEWCAGLTKNMGERPVCLGDRRVVA